MKTNSIDDQLSNLAALRPTAGRRMPAPAEGSAVPAARELIRLTGGVVRGNRHGSHLRVEERFFQEAPRRIDDRVFRLMGALPDHRRCDTTEWLFLDTETTGLCGGTGTYAFLTGLAWWEGKELVVEQFFMRDYGEEASVLVEIAERMRQRCVLVTYNGKSFDWPLLKTRYQMTRACAIPDVSAHLDLLHPARQIWRMQLGSVALKELERQVLQFDRGPDIPSETIPRRYFDFIRGGPPEAIAEVFYHNRMDLYGLARLALQMANILEDPEKSGCGPEALFGLSRLLQNRGEIDRARNVYRRCLEGELPEHAERKVHRELALMAKRDRNYDRSNAHWEKLLDGTAEGMNAYEQLAIYYEHEAAQFQKAAVLVREALVRSREAFHRGRLARDAFMKWHARFQRRLARLAKKTATDSSPPRMEAVPVEQRVPGKCAAIVPVQFNVQPSEVAEESE